MQQNTNLSRADKIILTINEMSRGKKTNLKFEDIVVAVFKKFPEDFHLRGYEEYPDSGDVIHKPLYDFRKKGFLEANNKVFCLTDRGITFAERLTGYIQGKGVASDGRLSRFAEKEIARIEASEAFALFTGGKGDKITDTDFYQYFGVSPRTSRNDFLGRLETVASAVDELDKQKSVPPQRAKIKDYHGFLTDKFSAIIQHFKVV